jgi:hypothetical protein
MEISKQFQEWADYNKFNYEYPFGMYMDAMQAAYKILQQNPQWLFPDMGSVINVIAKINNSEWDSNGNPLWGSEQVIQACEQYAAQEVAKAAEYWVKQLNHRDKQATELQSENESLKARIALLDKAYPYKVREELKQFKSENESLKLRVKELEELFVNTKCSHVFNQVSSNTTGQMGYCIKCLKWINL